MKNIKNILNINVFFVKIKEHELKKEKYNIVDIFTKRNDVVNNFINKYKSKEFKPFKITKVITLEKYQNIYDKYFYCHQMISKFYGDLTIESYKENLEKIKLLIYNDKKNHKLIKNQKDIIDSLHCFEIEKDINFLYKKIIKEYTKNTFYGDLNRWLREINIMSFDEVAYFTSRLMFSLNKYAKDNTKYFNENKKELYRGITLDYGSLLEYERVKGKKILFTSFTSMTKKIETARKIFAKVYEKNKSIFSVVFYITHIYKNGWTNGVDIKEISKFKSEEEVVYLPFSFYLVKDVVINISESKAEIYLEIIGKKDIFELKIRDCCYTINYNENKKIVELSELK